MKPRKLILRARDVFDTLRFVITHRAPAPGEHPMASFFARYPDDDEMVCLKTAMYALDQCKEDVLARVDAGQLSAIRIDRPPRLVLQSDSG